MAKKAKAAEIQKKKKRKEIEQYEARTFNREISNKIRRKSFSLPRVKRNGIITYDDEDDDNYHGVGGGGGSDNPSEEQNRKKNRKFQRGQLKLKKMLEKIKNKKKKIRNPQDEEIIKIENKMKHCHDIRNEVAAISNSIIGNQDMHIEKFDCLFFICRESLTRGRELQKRVTTENGTVARADCKANTDEVDRKIRYYQMVNALTCISICTVLKCVTPSYKIIGGENIPGEKKGNTEHTSSIGETDHRVNTNGKGGGSMKSLSKLMINVNNIEQKIVHYFKQFCTMLKENIRHNVTLFVNLLCEIVTVNLHLSRSEALFDYLTLYANIHTYSKKKYNTVVARRGALTKKGKTNVHLLCMKCLNTIKEIIENDSNLSFTITLVDYFTNSLFNREENVSPNLLKIFSHISIAEKKINAKLFSGEDLTDGAFGKRKDDTLRTKTNVCGELKIIEKNTEKILDQLFLVYLCVLRGYKKHSVALVKNALQGIAHYALYVNKLLMDDVFAEVKALAMGGEGSLGHDGGVGGVGNVDSVDRVDRAVPPTLRLTSARIFLEMINKVTDDSFYIDCSWVANTLLSLLDVSLPYFHLGSVHFLFEHQNFVYNSFADFGKCSQSDSFSEGKQNDRDMENAEGSNPVGGTETGGVQISSKHTSEKYNFCAELLYCIELLLKTKSFTSNYNTFKSNNNQLLARIVFQLYNIAMHADYIISFCILRIVQNILEKYPLVRSIVDEEGIVISSMNDNLSISFSNILFHSSFVEDLSSLALDISSYDSDESRKNALLSSYKIHHMQRKDPNRVIHFNLSLSEPRIVDADTFMKYTPDKWGSESTQGTFKKLPPSTHDVTNTGFKKASFGKTLLEKVPLKFIGTSANLSVNRIPSHMLTAMDFVEIVFSPYEDLITYFEKDRGKGEGDSLDVGISPNNSHVEESTTGEIIKKNDKVNRRKIWKGKKKQQMGKTGKKAD
ncbi:conserved Plasmodium protein, unknown function [Plasmodium knowlesi strain H]|uniref:Uncharacterized protein n=3 Tax=Plasmodium knowlesi TaxID=5850 RepID=A0A5K1VCQ7_PLAKH|nr:conserved Plasmodium protein, unknown function [Plasmodium knowlesi strain H]OTN65566.1 Uncharacterized protein PKNOH_S110085200 [Plasmodium knowlesi]CAA9989473.1 conserved Plasmodium protein, unknown function [Plasmodium knowlesi strain H]SBO25130.1 conserved Plasmodium protein, unknown function [Plasmodium knowlesi strain H]SBO27799.1 conserved Plasmodium protein, unknown function [Plasmodium knowlesi strain H]VVS78947.1 conserved Plasmodium protein, unknown function [Plasmodium knowlesi |eukprot:XP_002260199.1 hypothetical protein, conserved in Plasmodium species [Plasmodium knowlesi strain H]